MKYRFRTLSLDVPQIQGYSQLKETAHNLLLSKKFRVFQQLLSDEFVKPRNFTEIFDGLCSIDLDTDFIQTIQKIEWVLFLYDCHSWERQLPVHKTKVAQNIWRHALNNIWLRKTLTRILFFQSSQKQSARIIDHSLESEFSDFSQQFTQDEGTDSKEKELTRIVLWSLKGNYFNIAMMASEKRVTAKKLLSYVDLPKNQVIITQILDQTIDIFLHNFKSGWLINSLGEMTKEQQLLQVELFLEGVTPNHSSLSSEILNWLRKNYGHRTLQSRWSSLSKNSQTRLLQILNTSTWKDFEKIINVLLEKLNNNLEACKQKEENYETLEYQINQLKRRLHFWSNYSEQFQRFRILLPQESAVFFSSNLKQDVEILTPDGSEETEICIFDFGDYYVIEFFRGQGSEIRLFYRQSRPEIEEILFLKEKIFVKYLRFLGGEIHDHVYLWQNYAERWLKKHNIKPNNGLRYFKGVPFHVNQYNFNTGLPTPSITGQKQRNEKLKKWSLKIQELEEEAKIYCKTHGYF